MTAGHWVRQLADLGQMDAARLAEEAVADD
jgi:hypothetical protein